MMRYFLVFLALFSCKVTYSHSSFVYKVDPKNIARAALETDVFIPCTNTGNQLPIWEINGLYYNLFNLPGNIVPAVHGILLTLIEQHMDRTTFRCHTQETSASNGVSVRSSSVGVLRVYGEADSDTFTLSDGVFKDTYSSQVIIDHNQVSYNDSHIKIAWRANCSSCSENLKISSFSCGQGDLHNNPHITVPNDDSYNVIIPTDSLPGDAIITISGNDLEGHNCSTNESVLFQNTETLTLSKRDKGVCVGVYQQQFGLHISFTKRNDSDTCTNSDESCVCPIVILQNEACYDFTRCHCADGTTFARAATLCKSSRNDDQLELCFSHDDFNELEGPFHFFHRYYTCNTRKSNNLSTFRSYTGMVDPRRERSLLPKVLTTEVESEVLICIKFDMQTFKGVQVIAVDDDNGTFPINISNDNCIFLSSLLKSLGCRAINATLKVTGFTSHRVYDLHHELLNNITIRAEDKCSCMRSVYHIEAISSALYIRSHLPYGSVLEPLILELTDGIHHLSQTIENTTRTTSFIVDLIPNICALVKLNNSGAGNITVLVYYKDIECIIFEQSTTGLCTENESSLSIVITVTVTEIIFVIITFVIIIICLWKCSRATYTKLNTKVTHKTSKTDISSDMKDSTLENQNNKLSKD